MTPQRIGLHISATRPTFAAPTCKVSVYETSARGSTHSVNEKAEWQGARKAGSCIRAGGDGDGEVGGRHLGTRQGGRLPGALRGGWGSSGWKCKRSKLKFRKKPK